MISDPILKKRGKEKPHFSKCYFSLARRYKGLTEVFQLKNRSATYVSGPYMCSESGANDSTLKRILFLTWALGNKKCGRRT